MTRIAPIRTVLWTIGAFVAGIIVTAFGPSLVRSALSRIVLPEHRWEAARITSPDGTVDAVMVGSGCGPLCSDTYLVTVVPKGGKAPTDAEKYAFSAVGVGAYAGLAASMARDDPAWAKFEADMRARSRRRSARRACSSPWNSTSWRTGRSRPRCASTPRPRAGGPGCAACG